MSRKSTSRKTKPQTLDSTLEALNAPAADRLPNKSKSADDAMTITAGGVELVVTEVVPAKASRKGTGQSLSKTKIRTKTETRAKNAAPSVATGKQQSKVAAASMKTTKTTKTRETTTAPGTSATPKLPTTRTTKGETILRLLRSRNGATMPAIMAATEWQAHSVRGFLSATVRKRLGIELHSAIGKDGVRRYRIDTAAAAA